jgi:hypothetical protein
MSSTIFIKTATRERLKHIGTKGQTYDELINQLVDVKNTFQHNIPTSTPTHIDELNSCSKGDDQMRHESESYACESTGCSKNATDKIAVKVGNLGEISLLLCRGCVAKFKEVEQK